MPEQTRSYVAIDLKSFYASVECKERNLDPLTTNLVVSGEDNEDDLSCCFSCAESIWDSGKGKTF